MNAVAPKKTANPIKISWKSVKITEKKTIDSTPQNWIILRESLFNTNKFGNWIQKILIEVDKNSIPTSAIGRALFLNPFFRL